MSRAVVLAAASIVTFVALLPSLSGQDAGPVPSPLAFGPGASTFFIFANLDPTTDPTCAEALDATHMWDVNTVRAYASNNPDDPCAQKTQPDSSYLRANNLQAPAARNIFVYVMPKLANGTTMVEGEPMTVTVTFKMETTQPDVPLNFGCVRPKFTLTANTTTLGSWDAAPGLPACLVGPATAGAPIFVPFTANLGPAPAQEMAGPMRLTIELTNVATGAAPLRSVSPRVTLMVDEAHRGSLVLPFEAPPAPPAPEPEETEAPTPTNETPEPTPVPTNNTTTPAPSPTASNNTTDAGTPDEDTPALSVVAILGALVAATAVVSRRRR